MSQIKGRHTKPELIVRKFLFGNGFRFRLHSSALPGRPDIVLPKFETVINVHGCFWHGHQGCKYYVIPKTRSAWWKGKIDGNIFRDNLNDKKLKSMGWRVLTIWECQLKAKKKETTLKRLLNKLSFGK